jgi:hypothetical protein
MGGQCRHCHNSSIFKRRVALLIRIEKARPSVYCSAKDSPHKHKRKGCCLEVLFSNGPNIATKVHTFQTFQESCHNDWVAETRAVFAACEQTHISI